MERMLPGRGSWTSRSHVGRAVGFGLLMAFVLSGTALGQQIAVTGTVTSAGGAPLRGVTVQVQGTDVHVFTNPSGKYAIARRRTEFSATRSSVRRP